MRRREALLGLLFATPWLLGIFLFVGGPMVASFALSFTSYDIVSPAKYVGLSNYREAFIEDPLFFTSMGRTFYYALVVVPLGLFGSLFLAMLLNQGLRGTNLYRTFYFLPHLTPIVASALLWKWIFQPEVGVLNFLLAKVGIEGPKWLGSKEWAIPALMIMSLWGMLGGNRMMIFLAGLQGVPQELYEAAEIDGANVWHKFRHVTLPQISPTIFFNLVLGVIGALKVFASAFIATQGGPAYATWFFALHIYTVAFQYLRMGYAAALSWIFLLVMLVFTYIQVRSSGRWVFYAGER
jgi:multiple sugar transport system permease protein